MSPIENRRLLLRRLFEADGGETLDSIVTYLASAGAFGLATVTRHLRAVEPETKLAALRFIDALRDTRYRRGA